MTTEELLRPLHRLADEWPMGITVYHRACGKRWVLMGYSIIIGGELNLRVDYGGNGGWCNENPAVITTKKPGDGTEGDEWKETEERRD